MTDLRERLRELAVVPVVEIQDADHAGRLGQALEAGGLPVAEITFRTAAAGAAIERIRAECPNVLVGAGTVLTTQAVDRAVAAGASFVVTPGFNPEVVERCLYAGMPIVPGVNSPSQIEAALAMGLDLLKFFPAVPSGGIPMLKAFYGPYRDVGWMPTGGVTLATAPEWLRLPNVVAVGGTWIATTDAIAECRFDEVTRNARAVANLDPASH